MRQQRVALVSTGIAAFALAAHAPTTGAQTYDDIAPILAARCTMCHSGAAAAAGLALDSLDAVLRGGRNGPVIVAGAPDKSELIRRLTGQSQPRMPLTGPPFLSDAEIQRFERWIAAGLPAGGGVAPKAASIPRPAPGEPVTYRHVAPIFATRCAKCHTDKGIMGPAPEGYRLTAHSETVSARDRVRVVPGRPLASELFRRVRGLARPRMPMDGPPYLNEDEIGLIERWIADGARDASSTPTPIPFGARVRLHGTLRADGTLDGLLIDSGGVRTRKRLAPDRQAEVRGRVGADGNILVERVR